MVQGVTGASPISGIPIAILLGLGINNVVRICEIINHCLIPYALGEVTVPASLAPGLKFCTTTVLRGGIICIGAKLSAMDMVTLGAAGVPAVCASIGAGSLSTPVLSTCHSLTLIPAQGLIFVTRFGAYMGLPKTMSSLIAAGTSICGVTAITAVAPAIKATEKEMG